jgi:hypothetical protein
MVPANPDRRSGRDVVKRIGSGIILLLQSCAAVAAADFRLVLPVSCEIGRTCFIQQYVDLDPSKGIQDHRCGTLTYDGHDGTDFRVPNLNVQKAGVDVLAAAPGRVLRTRDGTPDISVRAVGRNRVEGTECGNGVVVAHEGGWETQYCHMAKDSVAVHSGDTVRAGQIIGRVGMSGLAEFPHLHFTVRRDSETVDPFAPDARPDTCGGPTSLWDEASRAALTYEPSAVINTGFAPGPVTMEAIESGRAEAATPAADPPALVAFVRAIGLKGGDVQRLSLIGPDGRTLRENRAEPLDRDKAQYMLFVGLPRPPAGWPTGSYRALYTIEREGRPALERSFGLDLKR